VGNFLTGWEPVSFCRTLLYVVSEWVSSGKSFYHYSLCHSPEEHSSHVSCSCTSISRPTTPWRRVSEMVV
jgi:hypothetical protein